MVTIKDRYNTKVRQCNLYLNNKSQRNADDITMYRYKIAGGSKKLLKNNSSLTGSDDKKIATSFYGKRQRRSRRIGFCPNF